LELPPLLRPVARALPTLTFIIATFCLDDSSFESYRLSGRKAQRWILPERRQAIHWQRARSKFRLTADEVYEDRQAARWAEEEMFAEAVRLGRFGPYVASLSMVEQSSTPRSGHRTATRVAGAQHARMPTVRRSPDEGKAAPLELPRHEDRAVNDRHF
jgi:hypothetical protein